MKYKLKQFWKNIKLYTCLPHFWILGLILILSIIACMISVIFMESNPFLSSVFANVFAGLVTGIVISLISTIKSMALYRTECLIEWLDSLQKDILKYIGMYQKMIFMSQTDFDDETFGNHIYDTLCCGNDLSMFIYQESFNNSLPFNPYKYIKTKFDYDAMNCFENNEKLREKIILLDVKTVTHNELKDLFKDMDTQLNILNGKIIKHIVDLKAKKKAINISFM